MNRRDLSEDRYQYGIRLRERAEKTEKLGIVGNLAQTSTAYLPRYDPNNSVNTATKRITGSGFDSRQRRKYVRHSAQNGSGIQTATYRCVFHGGRAARVPP